MPEAAVITCLLLLALWVLTMHSYRSYTVERHRLRLFEIRDELFDLARSGELRFSDEPYTLLRSMINGHIRFGNRTDFLFMFFVGLAVRGGIDDMADSLEGRGKNSLA